MELLELQKGDGGWLPESAAGGAVNQKEKISLPPTLILPFVRTPAGNQLARESWRCGLPVPCCHHHQSPELKAPQK